MFQDFIIFTVGEFSELSTVKSFSFNLPGRLMLPKAFNLDSQ